jgi:hypothetical protein
MTSKHPKRKELDILILVSNAVNVEMLEALLPG